MGKTSNGGVCVSRDLEDIKMNVNKYLLGKTPEKQTGGAQNVVHNYCLQGRWPVYGQGAGHVYGPTAGFLEMLLHKDPRDHPNHESGLDCKNCDSCPAPGFLQELERPQGAEGGLEAIVYSAKFCKWCCCQQYSSGIPVGDEEM